METENTIIGKHGCQKLVAMEISKLMITDLSVKIFSEDF